MELTNKQAEIYYNNLMIIASKITGKFAYSVARNLRKLNTELQEYFNIKNECIQKYGELEKDGVYSLREDSPKFEKYVEEMKQYDDIEISVELMEVTSEEVCNSSLSASEMISIDFMIKEE